MSSVFGLEFVFGWALDDPFGLHVLASEQNSFAPGHGWEAGASFD